MLIVLKGSHPYEGEIEQDFIYNERETAVAIGRIWEQRGWNPRLLCKSYDGNFVWLNSLSQRKAA